MPQRLNICLLNDSFPPVLDGVSNAVFNYAAVIHRKYGGAIVATPQYPGSRDGYGFPVVRYPSIDTSKLIPGYRTGLPYGRRMIRTILDAAPDIIHTHCPFASGVLAKQLKVHSGKPVVFTYHTKFDVDIENIFDLEVMRQAAKKILLSNIAACDEVWAVSRGAGENLESMGFEGEWRVMPNGVDFPLGKASAAFVAALRGEHGIPPQTPVFLFVGRMMWYKGLRIIVDGLARARARGVDFRMIFVGDGEDLDAVRRVAADSGIVQNCIFTGSVKDRERLRAYYSMADMFLLPSTFDNAPLVVREAAACECASVLIRGSSSAEGVTDGENGILIAQDAEDLSRAVERAAGDAGFARALGEAAARTIYLSWEDAVATAWARDEQIAESRRAKKVV
jgi:glycosyltransferase involved in cell wall biosynthesis